MARERIKELEGELEHERLLNSDLEVRWDTRGIHDALEQRMDAVLKLGPVDPATGAPTASYKLSILVGRIERVLTYIEGPPSTPGRVGFEAYNASTGGKTWDGKPVPTWDAIRQVTPHVVKAWEAAGQAVVLATAVGMDLLRWDLEDQTRDQVRVKDLEAALEKSEGVVAERRAQVKRLRRRNTEWSAAMRSMAPDEDAWGAGANGDRLCRCCYRPPGVHSILCPWHYRQVLDIRHADEVRRVHQEHLDKDGPHPYLQGLYDAHAARHDAQTRDLRANLADRIHEVVQLGQQVGLLRTSLAAVTAELEAVRERWAKGGDKDPG